jgi:hypothetical protein
MRTPDAFLINFTYYTRIETESNKMHCLDFYYYMTNALNDAKMNVGWTDASMTISIVEVIAQSENKWQNSRTTFNSSSSQIYQVNDF